MKLRVAEKCSCILDENGEVVKMCTAHTLMMVRESKHFVQEDSLTTHLNEEVLWNS